MAEQDSKAIQNQGGSQDLTNRLTIEYSSAEPAAGDHPQQYTGYGPGDEEWLANPEVQSVITIRRIHREP